MSFESCLICRDLIKDRSSSVTVNQFTDRSKEHHIHKWCFRCVKCHVPLTLNVAVISDDFKELLCMNDHIGNILPDCNYCGNNCANENVREGGFYFHKVKNIFVIAASTGIMNVYPLNFCSCC